ncbi:zinc finger matrin-type protein 5 isoform X1 [Ambystoma mexicanum]|uniref:zinc finger matrin-type protein 5 isoform X1 n=1 Tax=Ambystoma mexicanum TaxID=8296 RepID=UPI0037E8A982
MGKRYFCDYCNRSFQDNLHNRKKHLFGVQHQRSKKVWYDFFRDAAAILADEQNKKPCRKFLQTGECDFGNNCRFSHMTEDDVQQLTAHIEEEKRLRQQQEARHEDPDWRVEEWLEKKMKRRKLASGTSSTPAEAPIFQFPPGWPPVHELPPSLHPPPPEGWTIPTSIQWG